MVHSFPNSHSFFYCEVRNSTVVSKRPFVFFTATYNILQLHPNDHLFFYNKTQHFGNCTQTAIRFFYSETQHFTVVPKRPFVFFTTKHNILKNAPKSPFVFYFEIQNFESCTQTAICTSHKEMQNLTIYHQFIFAS